MQNNNNTNKYESQVYSIVKKLAIKKNYNKKIIEWLKSEGETAKAENIKNCGIHVGITNIAGNARIVKADFCREKLCSVCAWRRQAKFIAQMYPVMDIIEKQGYKLIFITLTIKNVPYVELKKAVDVLMHGFELLRKRRKIARAWAGLCRSIELTYNEKNNTFHPHIHLLAAVKRDYFTNENDYITKKELWEIWRDCIKADYNPSVDIKTTSSNDESAVEVLKYSLKPTQAEEAFKAFLYVMKNRRLISFTGIFSKVRQELKYSDFENILTDDSEKENKPITYELYKWI